MSPAPILESNFININYNEVKEFLLKPKNILGLNNKLFHTYRESAPQLWFFDEKEIVPGYYQFEIDGLLFYDCFIEKFCIDEKGLNQYCSGSYRVMTSS